MNVSSPVGRFWRCPCCRRHVPVRKDACICGFDSTTAEVLVATHGQWQPRGRSAFTTLWLFAAIAVLVGWISHDRLPVQPADSPENSSPPVAVSPVATSKPVSVEVVEGSDDDMHAFSAKRSGLAPATPQATILRNEAPRKEIASLSRASGGDEDERRAREEEAARRQQETEWRTRAARLTERLRSAHAAYRSQVCSEARGGIAVSTTRDNAGAYVSARTEAQALEESARLAGVPPGWVRISWSEFPEPEDPASGHHPAAVAERWGCGNVTGWGH
jgi:hypothetical protein